MIFPRWEWWRTKVLRCPSIRPLVYLDMPIHGGHQHIRMVDGPWGGPSISITNRSNRILLNMNREEAGALRDALSRLLSEC